MLIYNINDEIFNTQRVGWNNIINTMINQLKENNYYYNNIKNKNIIIIDYVDKYFNLWLDMEKKIIYNDKIYYYLNKDAYYYIKDNCKEDVFVIKNDSSIFECIKWYSEYNEFKLLRGVIETDIIKKYNILDINSEWIGIIHYPEFTKDMNYNSDEEFINIIKNKRFIDSLKYCKCLITLSDWLNKYIKNILEYNGIKNIKVHTIYHPTDFNCEKFSLQNYINNDNKSIIQLGFWMRKYKTIYQINKKKINKKWFPGNPMWKELFYKIYNDENYINNNDVEIIMNMTNEKYDSYLIKNIALVDVFNSSANNSILECIVRNTPIFVSKHPAIIEYLGKNYPLYFDTVSDINNIIDGPYFLNRISCAHNYLCTLDKSKFDISYFTLCMFNILSI